MTAKAKPEPQVGHNSAEYGQTLSGRRTVALRPYLARFSQGNPRRPVEIEFEARDLRDARRVLRVRLGTPTLPKDIEILEREALDRVENAQRARRARHLLRVLAEHFRWLSGLEGERADLANLDLSDVVLEGRDLTQANMKGSDLTRACLRRSRLSGANLSGAILRGADLRGADLRGADLSNADLRGALLIGAQLDGVDVWRANLAGAVITPEALHRTLNCKRHVEVLEPV